MPDDPHAAQRATWRETLAAGKKQQRRKRGKPRTAQTGAGMTRLRPRQGRGEASGG